MAAFSRGWVLPFTPFRLPICRRCIIRATTQQKRTLTPSLTYRLSSIVSKKSSHTNVLPEYRRNASSSSDSNKTTPTNALKASELPTTKKDPPTRSKSNATASEVLAEQTRAYLARMNENPALITPHAFASRLPKSGQILYQAPSQRRYIIAALITGSIFMFMGFGTVWIRETELTVQPWWVMLANGVVVIFCTGAGIWVFAGTLGICKRITAFPAAKARDGLRVIVEGSDYWLPWRTRTVEAALEDVSILRSMADAQSDVRRKFTPRLPDSEVSSFIRPFLKLGRGFGAFAKEVQNACSRQAHPSLLIRQGKGTETVKFKLDIRGQAFGGAKGFDRLIYPRI